MLMNLTNLRRLHARLTNLSVMDSETPGPENIVALNSEEFENWLS
jgi:hypothetical protein